MGCALASAMGAHTYRELVAWQLADDLQRNIVAITAPPKVARDFKFCNQIRDASLSVSANIAEGFARVSPPDFARFLTIAKGSLAETQVHLRSGLDRGYFDQDTVVELLKLAARCDRVTSALRAYLWKCKNRRP
jgi:four helix bundle protein